MANKVVVFDLDDTLYKEIDYKLSGLRAVQSFIRTSFQINKPPIKIKSILYLDDAIQKIISYYELDESIFESMLWVYRLHLPEITLNSETLKTLKKIQKCKIPIYIVSDGRLISQTLKLRALGLENLQAFITEKDNELKPNSKRFEYIQHLHPNINEFFYIADNTSKDFEGVNKIGWISICLLDNGMNIHKQKFNNLNDKKTPNLKINKIEDLIPYLC